MAKPAAVHEVVGGRQLRSSLRKAGDDLSDLKTAHSQAATVAAIGARQRAPVLTGALKATIRASGTKTAGIVRVGNNRKVRYAKPIHWGWPSRHIAANRFASEGAQATEPTWLLIYERYIDTTVDKIKGA